MIEIVGMTLGVIPTPNPEFSLLHSKDRGGIQNMAYYINDLFTTHKNFNT